MDVESLKCIMRNHFAEGSYKEALDAAQSILATMPDDWDATYLKATILSFPDPSFFDEDAALSLMESILQKNPNEANRWVGFGEVAGQCGKYEEAQHAFEKALELAPLNYSAVIGLAALEGHPGTISDVEKLRDSLQKATEQEPDNWLAYSYLARIQARLGDANTARDSYKSALRFIPSDKKYSLQKEGLKQELKRL